MTKIGEPSKAAVATLLASNKKRSWSSTTSSHHGGSGVRSPLFQKQNGGDIMMDSNNSSHHHHQGKKQPRREDGSPLKLRASGKKIVSKVVGQKKPPPPPVAPAAPLPSSSHQPQPPPSNADMQSILLRYHSLALAHASAAKHISKRRRLVIDSSRRNSYHSQHAKRLEQLAALKRMATETLEFTEEIIRGEEERYRMEMEMELEENNDVVAMMEKNDIGEEVPLLDWEEMNRRAVKEREVAEGLLKRYGISPIMLQDEEEEEVNNEDSSQHFIGGIPSKFLDLTHFPGLKQQQAAARRKQRMHKLNNSKAESKKQQAKKKSLAIIDCTEEGMVATSPQRRPHCPSASRSPARIPSFGYTTTQNDVNDIPQEIINMSAAKKCRKQNTKRIYISNASLPHVNGTFVQEGNYNGAPLFVRVGPPRKFMGKWDCGVVLRREKKEMVTTAAAPGGGGAVVSRKKSKKMSEKRSGSGNAATATTGSSSKDEEVASSQQYVWKIGLVPAHRITHPRIIGYFVADEDMNGGGGGGASLNSSRGSNAHRVSNMDRMDEDIDDDDDMSGEDFGAHSSLYLEPPVDGWRVFQETYNNDTGAVNVGSSMKKGVSTLGRATGLKVSYVE